MCESTSQFGDVLETTWTIAGGGTKTVTTTKLAGESQQAFELRHQVEVNRVKSQFPPVECPRGGN